MAHEERLYESKLKNGLIPAGEECPFKSKCGEYGKSMCRQNSSLDFSCGFARGFDLIYRK